MLAAAFRHVRRQPVAYAALFIALGGSSYAAVALPKNSVGSKQLRTNSVTSAKVKDRSLLAKDFKRGQLPAGANGAAGAQGPKGDSGLQGSQGAQGESGPRGPSDGVTGGAGNIEFGAGEEASLALPDGNYIVTAMGVVTNGAGGATGSVNCHLAATGEGIQASSQSFPLAVGASETLAMTGGTAVNQSGAGRLVLNCESNGGANGVMDSVRLSAVRVETLTKFTFVVT